MMLGRLLQRPDQGADTGVRKLTRSPSAQAQSQTRRRELPPIKPLTLVNAGSLFLFFGVACGSADSKDLISSSFSSSSSYSPTLLTTTEELLPLGTSSNLTYFVFPKMVTAGIAAQLFTITEWVLTMLGGFLFVQLMRAFMVAEILRLPVTLRQTVILTTLLTEGRVGGIGSFALISYHYLSGWGRQGRFKSYSKARASVPLLLSLLLVGGIVLVNISQASLKTVFLEVETRAEVQLPTSGWLLNGSLAESHDRDKKTTLTLFTEETSEGSYGPSNVSRLWAVLRSDGFSKEIDRYVQGGVLCARPAAGIPSYEKLVSENTVYCEGFTASCSPLEDVVIANEEYADRVALVYARKPRYIDAAISDAIWRSSIRNVSFGATKGDFFALYATATDSRKPDTPPDGFADVKESIQAIAIISAAMPVSAQALQRATGKELVGSPHQQGEPHEPIINAERPELISLATRPQYVLPGGGFAYNQRETSRNPIYRMWIGHCSIYLRRGIISPSDPADHLPVVRNWTVRNTELMTQNAVLRTLHGLPDDADSFVASGRDNGGVSALRAAAFAAAPNGINGSALAEALVSRGMASWFFSRSQGELTDTKPHLASWTVAEQRLVGNLLWCVLGITLYLLLLLLALSILVYSARVLHGRDKRRLQVAKQQAENCTSVWGMTRGSILLAPNRGPWLDKEGQVPHQDKPGGSFSLAGSPHHEVASHSPPTIAMSALPSEERVLSEAEQWICEPVLVTCRDDREQSHPLLQQVPALFVTRR